MHGFANAQFDVNAEEGSEIVDEFYTYEHKQTVSQQLHNLSDVQHVKKDLQQSVSTVN